MDSKSKGKGKSQSQGVFHAIHELVRMIPSGNVATYGQLAAFVGRCTARQVGFAMAAVPEGSDVPWHRVVNSRGRISLRGNRDEPCTEQLILLRTDGVEVSDDGAIDLRRFLWEGPPLAPIPE